MPKYILTKIYEENKSLYKKEVELTEEELKFALSHLEHWFPQDIKVKEIRKVLE